MSTDPRKWDPEKPKVLSWIAQSAGPNARVSRVVALPGSATTKHVIEIVRSDGSMLPLLLRRYHDAKRLAEDPWYVPANEALALTVLADTAVPAPRLYAADLQADICDVPAILESWLPGGPVQAPGDLRTYLMESAKTLVAIHSVRTTEAKRFPKYAPYSDLSAISPPSFSRRPRLWECVADALNPVPSLEGTTFIHRDYHPGNILWDGTRVTGVVDWATAAIGSPAVDLARMRLNLGCRWGPSVADQFVDAYVATGGDPNAYDPQVDLLDAADYLADFTSPAGSASDDFDRFETYVEGVLNRLR